MPAPAEQQFTPYRIDLRHKREVDNELLLADHSRGTPPILCKFLCAFRGQGAGQLDAKSGRSVMHVVTQGWGFHLIPADVICRFGTISGVSEKAGYRQRENWLSKSSVDCQLSDIV